MKNLVFISIILLFPASSASAQTAAEKEATTRYLRELQSANGGFLLAAPSPQSGAAGDQPSLRATVAALRALKYFGGEPKDRQAAIRYVEGTFQKETGGFSDARPGPRRPDVLTTALGLMAVVELKMPVGPYADAGVTFLGENAKSFEEIRMAAAALEGIGKRPPQTAAWLARILKTRNPDGTYGQGVGAARDTASAVVTVLRLGGAVEKPENVLRALKAGQRSDGGFGQPDRKESDLETCYRVMRCFHMRKEKPDVAKLRAFVASCRNADGGYGVAPGQKSTAAGTYFASIILQWLKQ